jgi:hypothetical protein
MRNAVAKEPEKPTETKPKDEKVFCGIFERD